MLTGYYSGQGTVTGAAGHPKQHDMVLALKGCVGYLER